MGEGALTSRTNGKKTPDQSDGSSDEPITTSAEVKKQNENSTNIQITSSSKKIAKQLNQVSPPSLLHQKLQLMHASKALSSKRLKLCGH